jgi:hypothetical protein
MIVHDSPISLWVQHDALTTWCVDISMALQNSRAAALHQAVFTVLVVIRAGDMIGATHGHVILVAGRDKVFECVATLTHAEEDVKQIVVFVHGCTFLDCISLCRVADDIVDVLICADPGYQLFLRGKLQLLDSRPEAAKGHVHRRVVIRLEDVRVDEIVSQALGQTDGAVVRPAANLEGG